MNWLRRFSLLATAFLSLAAQAAEKPNIVFILADDLGYGDVRCFNPESKIATPHLDRLAAGGMRFTDAHTSSSVCTPTRYGLLTGRYNWRSRLKKGVQGAMSPRLIEPGRLTVAQLLKDHGYTTACIGKWHLGMDFALKPGAPPFDDKIEEGPAGWNADFTQPIRNAPSSVGFDYFFGLGGSLDMVPYCFIENDHVTAQPSVDKAFPLMLGREPMTRRGPAAAGFEATKVLPELTRKAVEHISLRAPDAKAGRPFFLYLPLASPHTPIAPTGEWQGKSGLGPYADFVMQTDASVGAVLDALDRAGIAEDTLVFLTSDNGCSPQAKFEELQAVGHFPSAQFRGTKADIFEGGHRVPFIARWPGKVKAGAVSDQLICLNDFMATCAEILGAKLPENAAEDSVSMLPALLGTADKPLRDSLVNHSINGSFAIRQGSWKLALCPDSGGWSAPRPGAPAAKSLPSVQLYDLSTDIGETKNLQAERPEIVAQLTQLLERQVADGRSTPGAAQQNTGAVQLRPARAAASKPAATKPNILWLIAEDFGPALGCYGQREVSTPNLDALAGAGVRFTRAYTTAPVCSPSRSAFMTGMYQTAIGAHQHRSHRDDGFKLPPGVRVLSEWMRDAGYFTANVVELPPELGFKGTGKTDWNFTQPAQGGFDSPRWTDLAAHQPFFAQVNFQETHRKFHAPPHADPAKIQLPPYYPDHPTVRADYAQYLDAATELDRKVGLILAQLERDGLAENTLIVFFGDNGEAHIRGKQFCYEEGLHVPLLVRWPKSLAKPTHLAAGKVDERLVEMIDLAPTMLALAGAAVPPKMQGRVLFGEMAAPPREYAFGARDRCDETVFRLRTVRDARFRYIRNFTPERPFLQPNNYKEKQYPLWTLLPQLHAAGKLTPEQAALCAPALPAEELYDLEIDPHEVRNLASAPEHTATLQRLRAALEKWIADTDDQGRELEPAELAARKGVTRPATNPNAGYTGDGAAPGGPKPADQPPAPSK